MRQTKAEIVKLHAYSSFGTEFNHLIITFMDEKYICFIQPNTFGVSWAEYFSWIFTMQIHHYDMVNIT